MAEIKSISVDISSCDTVELIKVNFNTLTALPENRWVP